MDKENTTQSSAEQIKSRVLAVKKHTQLSKWIEELDALQKSSTSGVVESSRYAAVAVMAFNEQSKEPGSTNNPGFFKIFEHYISTSKLSEKYKQYEEMYKHKKFNCIADFWVNFYLSVREFDPEYAERIYQRAITAHLQEGREYLDAKMGKTFVPANALTTPVQNNDQPFSNAEIKEELNSALTGMETNLSLKFVSSFSQSSSAMETISQDVKSLSNSITTLQTELTKMQRWMGEREQNNSSHLQEINNAFEWKMSDMSKEIRDIQKSVCDDNASLSTNVLNNLDNLSSRMSTSTQNLIFPVTEKLNGIEKNITAVNEETIQHRSEFTKLETVFTEKLSSLESELETKLLKNGITQSDRMSELLNKIDALSSKLEEQTSITRDLSSRMVSKEDVKEVVTSVKPGVTTAEMEQALSDCVGVICDKFDFALFESLEKLCIPDSPSAGSVLKTRPASAVNTSLLIDMTTPTEINTPTRPSAIGSGLLMSRASVWTPLRQRLASERAGAGSRGSRGHVARGRVGV